MQIQRLIMERCGAFHGVEIGPLPAGLSLWYGPNEAGKSTMLDFIRIMLWGLQSHSYARYRESGVAGELWLQEGVHELRIIRQKQARWMLDGSPVRADLLQSWLNHVSMNVFESLYAFGLGELQAFETLDQDEVRGRIYSAGLGTGAVSIVEFQNRLLKERQALFLPKGEKPALNQAIQRLEQLQQELAAHHKDWSHYQVWREQQETIRTRMQTLDHDVIPEWEAVRARLDRRLARHAEGFRWQALSRQFQQYGAVSYGESELPEVIEAAFQAREASRHALEARREALAEAEALLAPFQAQGAWHEAWGQELDGWIGRLDGLGDAWDAAQERRAEAESALAAALEAFPEPLVDRVMAGEPPLKRAIEGAWRVREQARQNVRAGDEVRARAAGQLEAVESSAIKPPQIATLEELGALEARFRDALSLHPVRLGIEVGLLASAMLLTVLAGLLHPTMAAAVVLGAVVVLMATLMVIAVRRSRQAQGRLEAMQLVAERLAMPRGSSASAIAEVLDRLRLAIPQYQQHVDQRETARRKLIEEERVRDALGQQLAEAEAAWENLLNPLGLSGWQGEDVADILDELPALESWRARLRSAGQVLEKVEADWAPFLGAIRPALMQLGLRPDWRPDEWRVLRHELSRVHDGLREWTQKAEHRARALSQHEAARLLLERDEGFLTHALGKAGLDSYAAFESEKRRAEERRQLHSRIAEIEAGWQALPEADQAWLRSLTEAGLEAAEQELAEADRRLEEARTERLRLETELAHVEVSLRQLEDDGEASWLRQQIATTEAEIEGLARDWARIAILETAVQKSRQVFENERQPAVMQRAEAYFAEMTGGRYGRVRALMDGKASLEVEGVNGHRLRPEQLSRGTQEQLYLAMRLAWIEAMGDREEHAMPLLFDDILVNFDPERTHRTLQVLNEVAKNRQVMMWTCHPHIAEAAAQLGAHIWRDNAS